MAHYALIVGLFTGLIAEFIYKSGDYKSQSKAVLTCGVFSMWVFGNFIPLFFNREAYWATRQSFGEEYITTLNSLMPMWLCPVLPDSIFGVWNSWRYSWQIIIEETFQKKQGLHNENRNFEQ